MSDMQADLFGVSSRTAGRAGDEVAAIVRARPHATLALVQSATAMPWADTLSIIRAENAFRFDKDALPPAEARALRAAFDVEMDRLYAVLNAGADPAD